MLRRYSKEERSWIMYDWANSVFATIMMAAVFPVFFVSMAGEQGVSGSMWWGIGTSGARFLLAIAVPVLGAIIDYRGYKKRLFVSFIGLGILLLMLLSAQSDWRLMLALYVLANIFWSAGNFVYDSYLPDITTPERMDKVSTTGFAMGYIGGSTIPFIVSIVLIMFGGQFGVDITLAVRISVVITAVWWGAFSAPIIKNVHHKYGAAAPQRHFVRQSISNTLGTAKKIVRNKGLFLFIVAYFFYIDGVGTVINMAAAYGSELNLSAAGMIGALFLTQIVAVPCSLLFGKLSGKVNPLNLIIAAIVIYCVICLTGFFMGFGLEEYWFGVEEALIIFWVLAFMVGTVQGGIQALSRSCYAKLVPPENSGEYFGFFEIFGRFAAILGPGLYAVILAVTGRGSFSILSTIALFVTGLVVLLVSRKHLALNN